MTQPDPLATVRDALVTLRPLTGFVPWLGASDAVDNALAALTTIEAELTALRGDPWRPVESAPKDGKPFRAYTSDFMYGRAFNQREQQAKWSGKTPTDPIGHFQSENGQMVTHWQPLTIPATAIERIGK